MICFYVRNTLFFYTPAKQMLSEIYWNQPVFPSLCVSVSEQNTSNFLLQTPPTVLLHLYQLFTKQQIFGLDQIRSICRQQIKCC